MKKFDMDYDGMGNQGRFPTSPKKTKIIKEKLSYVAVIVFWFIIVMVLSSCEKEEFTTELDKPNKPEVSWKSVKPDISIIEQTCCDWDAANFQFEFQGHNVNQLYFTNSPLCNNNLCIYP